jgi:hypothetical protein
MALIMTPIINMKLNRVGINNTNFHNLIFKPMNKDDINVLKTIFGNGNPEFDELEAKFQLLLHYKKFLKPKNYSFLHDFILETNHYKAKDAESLSKLMDRDYNGYELDNSIMKFIGVNNDLNDIFVKNYVFKLFILEISSYNIDKDIIEKHKDLLIKEYSEFPIVKTYIYKPTTK